MRQRATQRGALPSVEHKEQERRKARALDGEGTSCRTHLLGRTARKKTRDAATAQRSPDPDGSGREHRQGDDPPDAEKNELKPWLKKGWCIPPEQNAAFVCAMLAHAMEDVLEVYSRPYNAARPQVCLDEAAKQILSQMRAPIPLEPGQIQRVDNEYVRHGTCGTARAARHVRFVPVVRAIGGQARRAGSRSAHERGLRSGSAAPL